MKKSVFPFILALLILGGVGYYGYTRYLVLETTEEEIIKSESFRNQLEEELGSLAAPFSEAKAEFKETELSRVEKVKAVFPEEEELTELTRTFDDFEVKNNFSNNPFFISSLNFKEAMTEENLPYRILPIDLSIQSSTKNFFKFLEYVENSGSLDTKVRLMEINSINVDLNSKGKITFQVSLNAYFQKLPE